MKKLLVTIPLIAAALLSCNRQEAENSGSQGGGNQKPTSETLKIWGRTPDGAVWTAQDRIGLYTTDDFNVEFKVDYLEEGKENRAYFAGEITPEATVLGAYYPYSASAGENMSAIPLYIPENVSYGEPAARFDIAEYRPDSEIKLFFRTKLSKVVLRFRNVEESVASGLPLQEIKISGQRNMAGLYAANLVQPEQMLSGLNATNAITVDMKGTPLADDIVVEAAIAAMWKGGDVVEVSVNGGEYSQQLSVSSAVAEGESVELTVNAKEFNPKVTLDWISAPIGLEEGAETSEIRGNIAAVDNAGNVYVQPARGAASLYKLNAADGSLAWATPLGYTLDNNASPSCEPDGSVIYAIGGTSGSGRVTAVSGADGSVKWTVGPESFFGNGATPAPNFNGVTPAIGEKNIYVGNAGTTGTVLTLDKETGERVSYVSGAADGTGGPSGGVTSGLAMTSSGQIAWHCSGGIFTADRDKMDNPDKTHDSFGSYVPWAQRFSHGWSYSSARSGVACSKIDGQDAVWAVGMEKTTSGSYNMHVMCSKVESGKELSFDKKVFLLDKSITNVTNQDQGGIVIGPRGEAIVSMKGYPGAIKAFFSDGTEAYSYTLPGGRDVCGSCAVDNNGYVHIAGDFDSGACYYVIVKPDYENHTCELVASAELCSLIREYAADALGDNNSVRAWSSVAIGNDGKMYLAVTTFTLEGSSWKNHQARVIRLSYKETTGPSAASPWPQRGADASHTGRQRL